MRILYFSLALATIGIAAIAAEPLPAMMPAVTVPPVAATPAAVAAPAPTTPAPASAVPYTEPVRMPVVHPVTATLNDGSKVQFDADDTVWVLNADGSKDPAPDGVLTLRDGTPFVVRDGKRVGSE